MNKTIYWRLTRALQVAQAIEENGGELTPELEEAFKFTSENVAERAEEMVDIRANCEMLMAQSRKRIADENAFIEQQEKVIAALDKGLISGVELMKGKIQAGPYALSIRKSEATIITDWEAIPDKYRKPIVIPKVPETPKKGEPDKDAIKKAFAANEFVEGAYVDKRSKLVIK